MAQFSFNENAIPNLINSLESANLYDTETTKELLFSGCEILEDEVKKEYDLSNFGDTGETKKHIKYRRKVETGRKGGKSVTLTVTGKDKRGQRYGAKAFVLNYGRDKRYGEIKGSYYWTKAKKKAEPKMIQKCEEIATKKLKTKGLI